MNQQQIEATVIKAISLILKSEIGATSTRSNTENWDSLKHIEIIFSIEDELGIQFSEQDLPLLDGVQSIVRKAMEKCGTT